MGVVALALIGTVADLFAAVAFARADKMDIVLGLCIGSAIQIALVVAPILVLTSWAIGRPMNLVFDSPLGLFAIAGAAVIVRAIVEDGETNWFEGVILSVYTFCLLWRSSSKGKREGAHAVRQCGFVPLAADSDASARPAQRSRPRFA